VLYVTHDQVEAMTLADKIVIMRDGHVEQVGTPEEVYVAPKSTFVATFIGSPSMNMIETRFTGGRLVADGLSIPVPPRFGDRVKDGQEVTLGIRPIEIQRVADDAPGAMAARVEVTEYLGNEALLDLRVGCHDLMAEVPADQRAAPGETVHVRLNEAALHLFDTRSGRSLAQ
jgi:multiple sugar transport system ATP-binding protein